MTAVKKKPQTILELMDEAGSFSTLVDAIQQAGLTSTLKKTGPFTLFAPDDEAFRRLSKGTLKSLLKRKNQDELKAILMYHVVEERHRASDVAVASSLTALSGDTIQVEKKGNVIYIDEARIRRTNMEAENGIVHVIDRVLMPDVETV